MLSRPNSSLDNKFSVFAEMYLAINNGNINADSCSRCLTSKGIGVAGCSMVRSELILVEELLELEEEFYLEKFNARLRVIEVRL